VDKFAVAIFLVLILAIGGLDVAAQNMSTRFGIGAGAVVNPSNSEVSEDDLGIDLRARVSRPISGALSLAAGVGAFIFNVDEQTEYVVNPQVSLIATFGGARRFPYVLAGVGAVLPAEQDRDSQLEVHAGFGWAWPFGSRTSAFAEIDPIVSFRAEGIAIMVPLRGGLIF
jgi:hypothetical protein